MKLHRRFGVLVVVALSCVSIHGQFSFPAPQAAFTSLKFDVGSTARQFVLDLTPAPGDFLQVQLSTARIRVAIRTPDNRTITSTNAKDEGFEWFPWDEPVPLQLDAAQNVQVVFAKPAVAGRYVLEFSLAPKKFAAHADVRFVSRVADYTALLRAMPGARVQSANVSGSADIPIDVRADFSGKEPQFLDIVTKAAGDVSVTTPSGKVLKPGTSKEDDGYSWTSFEEQYGVSKREISWLSFPPVDGIHQLLSFKKIDKGRYVIHVQSRQEMGVTVVFVPMEEMQNAVKALQANAIQNLAPAPDEVKIEAQQPDLGHYPLVGDKLPLVVKILGDIGASAPKFEARMQTVPALVPPFSPDIRVSFFMSSVPLRGEALSEEEKEKKSGRCRPSPAPSVPYETWRRGREVGCCSNSGFHLKRAAVAALSG